MSHPNHALSLFFNRFEERLWSRYQESAAYVTDKKLPENEIVFHTAQAVAYDLLLDDVREMRKIFNKELSEN